MKCFRIGDNQKTNGVQNTIGCEAGSINSQRCLSLSTIRYGQADIQEAKGLFHQRGAKHSD